MRDSQTQPSFIPMRDGHAVPIDGLSPDCIKESARRTIKGPGANVGKKSKPDIKRRGADIGHATILNFVAKTLGFNGGWPSYQRDGWPLVASLLKQNGLGTQQDLFERARSYREALSGLLFHSGRPLPKRVFRKDGSEWEPFWSRPVLPYVQHVTNLLGDLLIDPQDGTGAISEFYFQRTTPPEFKKAEDEKHHEAATLLRKVIDSLDDGWLRIIPVTNRLVLLGDRAGVWDFVFADLRSYPPPAPSRLLEMLHQDDVPSFVRRDDMDERKEYFRSGVWRTMEAHKSEIFYYEQGGLPSGHPGCHHRS